MEYAFRAEAHRQPQNQEEETKGQRGTDLIVHSPQEIAEAYLDVFALLNQTPCLPAIIVDSKEKKKSKKTHIDRKYQDQQRDGAEPMTPGIEEEQKGVYASIMERVEGGLYSQYDPSLAIFQTDQFQSFKINTPQQESAQLSNEIKKELIEYLQGDFKIVVLGITNSGKSTFLNNLLKNGVVLITSVVRETACIWRIKFTEEGDPSQHQFSLQAKYKTVDKSKATYKSETFETLDQLKQAIKKYKTIPEEDSEKLDIQKITIKLPSTCVPLAQIVNGNRVSLVDLPGMDDFYQQARMLEFLNNQKAALLPIIIVDSAQGSIELDNLSFLKDVSKDIPNLEVIVVFTMFTSAMNNQKTKLRESDDEMDEQQLALKTLSSLASELYSDMKLRVQKLFPKAKFFLFDPKCKDLYTTLDISLIYDSKLSQVDFASTYQISDPFPKIFDALQQQFQAGLNPKQIQMKSVNLVEGCYTAIKKAHRGKKTDDNRFFQTNKFLKEFIKITSNCLSMLNQINACSDHFLKQMNDLALEFQTSKHNTPSIKPYSFEEYLTARYFNPKKFSRIHQVLDCLDVVDNDALPYYQLLRIYSSNKDNGIEDNAVRFFLNGIASCVAKFICPTPFSKQFKKLTYQDLTQTVFKCAQKEIEKRIFPNLQNFYVAHQLIGNFMSQITELLIAIPQEADEISLLKENKYKNVRPLIELIKMQGYSEDDYQQAQQQDEMNQHDDYLQIQISAQDLLNKLIIDQIVDYKRNEISFTRLLNKSSNFQDEAFKNINNRVKRCTILSKSPLLGNCQLLLQTQEGNLVFLVTQLASEEDQLVMNLTVLNDKFALLSKLYVEFDGEKEVIECNSVIYILDNDCKLHKYAQDGKGIKVDGRSQQLDKDIAQIIFADYAKQYLMLIGKPDTLSIYNSRKAEGEEGKLIKIDWQENIVAKFVAPNKINKVVSSPFLYEEAIVYHQWAVACTNGLVFIELNPKNFSDVTKLEFHLPGKSVFNLHWFNFSEDRVNGNKLFLICYAKQGSKLEEEGHWKLMLYDRSSKQSVLKFNMLITRFQHLPQFDFSNETVFTKKQGSKKIAQCIDKNSFLISAVSKEPEIKNAGLQQQAPASSDRTLSLLQLTTSTIKKLHNPLARDMIYHLYDVKEILSVKGVRYDSYSFQSRITKRDVDDENDEEQWETRPSVIHNRMKLMDGSSINELVHFSLEYHKNN